MNYYTVDFSSTNKMQPSYADMEKIRNIDDTIFSHDYGMGFDSRPTSHCDHIMNCRTEMTVSELREKLSFLRCSPMIAKTNPDRITMRGFTVKSELDSIESDQQEEEE